MVECAASQPIISTAARLDGVVGVRDLGVEGRGEGPGLGSVDDDLDEPQPLLVGPQAAFRATEGVVARDPRLVGVPVQRPPVGHRAPGAGDVQLRDPGSFCQVVVISTGPVRLDVVPGFFGAAAVELHATVHGPVHRPSLLVNHPENGARSVSGRRTELRTFVACVPLE